MSQNDELTPQQQYIQNNKKCSITISFELLNSLDEIIRDEKKKLFLYQKTQGIYNLIDNEDIESFLLDFIIKYDIRSFWTGNNRASVTKFFYNYKKIPTASINNYENLICLNNGVLNVDTRELKPHSPDFHFSTKIDINYNPTETSCPNFQAYLETVFNNNQELIDNIIMLGGYLLSTSNAANKMFLFDGPGGSGKSTIIDVFKMFFTPEQKSALSLETLASNSFEKELLLTSRVNFSTEEKSAFLDAEELKKIISGESITVNPKNRRPITLDPVLKLILACNGLPRFRDTSEGIARRLLIFPFENRYVSEEEYQMTVNPKQKKIFPRDLDLSKKLRAEKDAIFNLFLEGLSMLKANKWQFLESSASLSALKQYRRDSDSVREFLEDNFEVSDEQYSSVKEVYEAYRTWHKENVAEGNYLKFRTNEMGRRIKEVFMVEPLSTYKEFFNPLTEKTELLRAYPIKRKTNV